MKGERPWFASEAGQAGLPEKRHAPATLRNRDAIAAVLAGELPSSGLVLEVASGSGEHAAYFAGRFPALEWQPTDPDPAALASIDAWGQEADLPNLRPPLALDAALLDWPVERAAAILCINMIHISPWEATLGLFAGAERVLESGAPLILYGPFFKADVDTAPSNMAFHAQLKERDQRFGLRDVAAVDAAAADRGFRRTACNVMPANNLTLVYRFS
ncbi:MAG: DUF938 domain-containing protein [Sphingobium sp.]